VKFFDVWIFKQNFVIKQSGLDRLSMNLVHVYLEGSLRILEVDPLAFRLPDKSKEVARLLFCFQHAEKDSLSVKLARLSLVNSEDSE